MTSYKDNAGKTIVVVGASSGFGRGSALEFAKLGASVVLPARRTNLLDELVAEISNAGGTALAVTTDVSKPEDIQALRQGCRSFWNG